MRKQTGNILFLILLAVVLFAALSYAVTSSMRGGNKNAGDENNTLTASQMIEYGTLLRTTILRLKLVNGCTDEQISFQNAIEAGYTNTNSPTDRSCWVFDPAGGALSWRNTPEGAGDTNKYIINGRNRVENVGTTCGDISCSDLILFSLESIPESLCFEINNKLGIDNTSITNTPNVSVSTKFTTIGFQNVGERINGASLLGREEGCFESNAGNHHFFYVLVSR